MKRISAFGFLLFASMLCFAQSAPDSNWKKIYRETATRVNDLIHTKLDLRPDFNKSWLY